MTYRDGIIQRRDKVNGKEPKGCATRRCPPCIGAIVGGIVEGGINLGTQLYHNGGNLSAVNGRELVANIAGGAVTGALAGATGGASILGSELLGEAAVGAGSNILGGEATRDIEGEETTIGGIATDAVSGFVSGGVGHLAADVIHVPEDPALPGSRRHAVGRRNLAKYDAAVAQRNAAIQLRTGVDVGAASPATHVVGGIINNFWNTLDWLMSSGQQEVVTHRFLFSCPKDEGLGVSTCN